MPNIEIYTTQTCPFCLSAKALMSSKNLQYTEIDVTTDIGRRQEMMQRSGNRTVPQIFINEESIGGFDELSQLNAKGQLPKLDS